MAIQGTWHDFIWEVSSSTVRSITSISVDLETDYERNEDSEGKPPTQIVRRKLRTVDLSYRAMAALKLKPEIEIEMWDNAINQGIHAPLYIAGKPFFAKEYLCKSAKIASDYVDSRGRLLFAEIDVQFEEYAEEASGLKVDKGFEISLTPGIQDYRMTERDQFLMFTADQASRHRMRLMEAGEL